MKKSFACFMGALAVSTMLGSGALAQKIDQTYSYMGLGGSNYGDMVIGVKAINNNGKVAVCGIGWVEPFKNGRYSASSLGDLREISSKIRYSLAGKSLRFSTAKFPFVKGAEAASRTDVSCAATRVDWTSAMDGARIEMSAGRITIRK
ncbi:MAG: hypothetical protein AAGI09_08225 [Pseudomonadota bacterium]